MSHDWQTLGGGVQADDERRRPFIQDPPKGEVTLPILLHGPGRQVTGGAPPLPSWDWKGDTVVENPASSGPPTLSSILSKDNEVGGIPPRGLHDMVNELYQPTDSLCALPRMGHGCDYGGRQLILPPLLQL